MDHLIPVLLVVEENIDARLWLLYLEYPEVGNFHPIRHMLIRALQLDLVIPVVVVSGGERDTVDGAGDSDSDDPLSGWLLDSSGEE